MMDPRLSVLDKRFSPVKVVIAVTGWKGGIGKSAVSCMLALLLAKKGAKTGLLDLDFSGSSGHVILGAKNSFPQEKGGLLPPRVGGVKFMSVSFFAKENAVALRGAEITDAILELLAVTQWGELDFLIVDMPPGIADAGLDLLRFVKKARFLAVAVPSELSRRTAERSAAAFKRMGAPLLGYVENMSGLNQAKPLRNMPKLGVIRFDMGFERALGSTSALLKTGFAKDLEKLLPAITENAG